MEFGFGLRLGLGLGLGLGYLLSVDAARQHRARTLNDDRAAARSQHAQAAGKGRRGCRAASLALLRGEGLREGTRRRVVEDQGRGQQGACGRVWLGLGSGLELGLGLGLGLGAAGCLVARRAAIRYAAQLQRASQGPPPSAARPGRPPPPSRAPPSPSPG